MNLFTIRQSSYFHDIHYCRAIYIANLVLRRILFDIPWQNSIYVRPLRAILVDFHSAWTSSCSFKFLFNLNRFQLRCSAWPMALDSTFFQIEMANWNPQVFQFSFLKMIATFNCRSTKGFLLECAACPFGYFLSRNNQFVMCSKFTG